jgi:pilus assembly protein Flp/PilA
MKRHSKRSQSGATAIEYGLIAALMVLAMIPAIESLGGNTNGMYTNITNKVGSAMATAR